MNDGERGSLPLHRAYSIILYNVNIYYYSKMKNRQRQGCMYVGTREYECDKPTSERAI